MVKRLLPRDPFWSGLLTGIAGALLVLVAFDTVKTVAQPLLSWPDRFQLSQLWAWVYDNLHLSLVPFGLILLLYFYQLNKLSRLLDHSSPEPDRVAQAENWITVCISMFFGTGVIWTAIGMRSALLAGLADLGDETVVRVGAFEILRRLVEGGILLALSTTIVGAMGGYLMRLNKIIRVGAKQQRYYRRLAQAQWEAYERKLGKIESHLARLVALVEGGGNPQEGERS